MPGTVEKNYIGAISAHVSETNARTAPHGFFNVHRGWLETSVRSMRSLFTLGYGELFPAIAHACRLLQLGNARALASTRRRRRHELAKASTTFHRPR